MFQIARYIMATLQGQQVSCLPANLRVSDELRKIRKILNDLAKPSSQRSEMRAATAFQELKHIIQKLVR